MTIVALVGDCTTTTTLAIAAAWPVQTDVVVFEADRSGGSLTGWLGTPVTPSVSTLVASQGSRRDTADNADPSGDRTSLRWTDVENVIQHSNAGVRFIAAPLRSQEAARALAEADRSLVPLLAVEESTLVLADVGRILPADPFPAAVVAARAIVVVHRQDASSAGAAAVRLDRLVELVDRVAGLRASIAVAVVGDRPFDLDEIAAHLAASTTAKLHDVCSVAADPLSAMVLAGRAGVSAKRLGRLPLARSVRLLVDRLADPTGTIDQRLGVPLGDVATNSGTR